MNTTRMAFAAGWIMALATAVQASSNVNVDQDICWAENVGWINWAYDAAKPDDGVYVAATYLWGMAWSENVGWINFGGGPPSDQQHYANNHDDSSTFGVNVDPATGELFGLAWGENIGWINFDTRTALGNQKMQARLDQCSHELVGYAWGENVGWINLDDDSHFVSLGPDCAPGDVACDGVIQLVDYAVLESTLTGPGVQADCSSVDADSDGDVDLFDFAKQQGGLSN